MKPTNNGNCKNGDSGHYHHYWRCKKSALHTGWLIFRSRFLNKITGKIFQNFELYFLNFFLFAPQEQHEKNRGKMIEQHSALKRILWSWQHPLYESKYQKKFGKKRFRLAASVIILEFFDLFTHFGNHTGSQRKKLHFPCQSLSFYYPLI